MKKTLPGLALALTLAAAFLYRAGWQELAATVWFVSLTLLLPVMGGSESAAPALQPVRAEHAERR